MRVINPRALCGELLIMDAAAANGGVRPDGGRVVLAK
jgi:hypothetical protein